MRTYRQISDRDRVKISRLKANGLSISEIARKTGFNKSSISREFKRNSDGVDDLDFWNDLNSYFTEDPVETSIVKNGLGWNASVATRTRKLRAWRANQKRRRKSSLTVKWAISKIKEGWSPNQIAGRSKLEKGKTISHECIYEFIRKDRKAGGRLFTYLKRFRKRKRRLSHRSYAGQLPGRIFIDKRPKIVEKRIRLGDLEADLICGRKAQGYLLTVVDRVSRKVVLRKLKTKSKEEVYFALCNAIEEFKIIRTITVDNGKEFALHKKIKTIKKVSAYFTHPYTSQEKGTVENTNGLIRYYFNSKTNFKLVKEKRIKEVENKLNQRPRKILGYLTPNEVQTIKMRREKPRKNRCT